MEKNLQKYKLIQNNRLYVLTTQIQNEFVNLKCIESGTLNPSEYIGNFSLNDLRQFDTLFNNFSTKMEAQELINQTIKKGKVSIEHSENTLNIVLYIGKGDLSNDSCAIKMSLNPKETIYDQQLGYHSDIQESSLSMNEFPKEVESSNINIFAATPINMTPEEPEDTSNTQDVYTANDIYKDYQTHEHYKSYDNFNLNSEIVDNNYINNQIPDSFDSLFSGNNYNYNYETQTNQYDNEYQTKKNTETHYENYNIPETYISPPTEETNYFPFPSPKREQIEFVIPGSPSTAQITYSSAPSHKRTTIETTKTTEQYNTVQVPTIDTSSYEKKIYEFQKETKKLREENNSLKNQSVKLYGEIGQLKGKIQMLLEENRILKEKNNSMPNQAQSHEINILKKENERLRIQLEEYLGIKNTFEQYKIFKEEELKYLKIKNEELLKRKKYLEEINEQKPKEIDELKTPNQRLISNENIPQEQENYLKNQQQQISEQSNQTIKQQKTSTKVVKGDIIHTSDEIKLLTRKICKNHKKITYNLLYKATVDTDKAQVFHNKCDWASKTLVLIESKNGKRFGGYTTCNWEGDCIEKNDDNAFVFSLDKMKTYQILPDEEAIGCYPKYGPVFLGCQIRIFDEFFKNGGTTFEGGITYDTEEDYELSGGEQKFDVKEIEVYEVQLQ